MLKSRYDHIFWGKTPWSLLHALLVRQKNFDVLVIDDQTLSLGSGGHRWLTYLEVGALQEMGEKFAIKELKGLEAFLRPARLKIQTPHFQWVTGLEVKDNLREFIRKFPVFQTPTLKAALDNANVTQDLLKVQRSFLDWFRSGQVRNRSTAPFVAAGVPWFLEFQRLLSEELLRAYQQPGDGHLAQLLACYSSATGQVVKYTFADHEAAYVAMRLLSPVWELDQRWLERELLRELQSVGAHTKKTKVNSWQLWDLKVEAALLDSYEGVVTSERLLLYGFPQSGNQLICKFSDKVFRGLETTWPSLSNPALEEPKAELTCLTGPHLMGTDIPMMLLDEDATRLQVLVEEREGDKPAFYRHEANEISRPIIAQAINRSPDWWKNEKAGNSWDVWLEDSSGDIAKGQLYLHELRPIKVVESENQNAVLGMKYWGPLMTRRFGLLGYLTELYWDLV